MIKPSIKSMAEMADEYKMFVKAGNELSLNLGCWLPSLGRLIRPLIPGELCFVMADTGVGKSMVLQNIAIATSHTSLFFEMELPGTLMYERFMAASNGLECIEVERNAQKGQHLNMANCGHIYVCDASRMSTKAMYELIMVESDKVIGAKPLVVFVDYIALMAAGGKSRYEKVAESAESLKVLAKESNTIVVGATQVSRKEGEDVNGTEELFLHNAKNAGEIENSCGLLMGMWRDPDDPINYGWLKGLKNTKGKSGWKVKLAIDGARMRISESAYTERKRESSERTLEYLQ